ncbi:MAG: ethylbenzene dehydrogenase-related protein [Thermoplasmata archaeon]
MRALHVKVLLLVAIAAISFGLVQSNISIAQPALVMHSVYVEGTLPVTDPTSALWDLAEPVEVPLSGQGVTEPIRPLPSTAGVKVRALNNGTHIAFQVAWPDGTKDNRTTKSDEFRDATALLFASSTLPGICMGSRGQTVHIVQWKADWQADIEEGFRDLEDAYPNFWVDYYPFAVGDPPYTLPDAFPEEARELLVGWAVGNPFSEPLKVTSVEDAIAQGFGTIATQERQDAIGRGVWRDDSWTVVISRELSTGDPEDLEMAPGDQYYLAIAVWDGASGDVGARKSVTSWVTLQVSAPPRVLEAWLVALVVVPPVGAVFFIRYIIGRRKRD